jgi:hypothetical protein
MTYNFFQIKVITCYIVTGVIAHFRLDTMMVEIHSQRMNQFKYNYDNLVREYQMWLFLKLETIL